MVFYVARNILKTCIVNLLKTYFEKVLIEEFLKMHFEKSVVKFKILNINVILLKIFFFILNNHEIFEKILKNKHLFYFIFYILSSDT